MHKECSHGLAEYPILFSHAHNTPCLFSYLLSHFIHNLADNFRNLFSFYLGSGFGDVGFVVPVVS